MKSLVKFIRDEEGLTTVEYAIAGGLVGAGVIVGFDLLGVEVARVIDDITGALSAIVSRPALTMSAIPDVDRRLSTSDKGPGQKASARCRAVALNRPNSSASARPGTCTISGLKRGRPLAAKIAATARSLVETAPSP